MLLALNLKLLLERSPPFLVFDELLKRQTIDNLGIVAFSHVNLDTIDLCRVWVDHLVTSTREVALSEDNFTLELFAVVTELERPSLVAVLDLQQLKLV